MLSMKDRTPIEEIRQIVELKEKRRLNDKLFDLFSSIGLILGLIVFTFTFGILFGIVVFTVWGFKKMCTIITSLFKHSNNTVNDGDIINLNKEVEQ